MEVSRPNIFRPIIAFGPMSYLPVNIYISIPPHTQLAQTSHIIRALRLCRVVDSQSQSAVNKQQPRLTVAPELKQ